MLTGGALGAVIVLSITIAGPKIGTTAVVGLLIAGQLVAATAIDRFGWFGFDGSRSTGRASSASRCSRPAPRSRCGAEPHDDAIQSTVTGPGKAPIASPRRRSSVTAERPSSP